MTNEWVEIGTAFLGALGFAIIFNIRGKRLWLSALGGMISWGLEVLLRGYMPSETLRVLVAAMIASLYAQFMARALKSPATLFVVPAAIPMIPGGGLYAAMRFALMSDWPNCLERAVYTIKIAAAIAIAMTAASAVMRAFDGAYRHILLRQLNRRI